MFLAIITILNIVLLVVTMFYKNNYYFTFRRNSNKKHELCLWQRTSTITSILSSRITLPF